MPEPGASGPGASPAPGVSAAPVASVAPPVPIATPDTSAGCVAAPTLAAPAPSAAPPVGASTVLDTAGTTLDLISVPLGNDPAGIAVDSTDTYGRVFVAVRGDDVVEVRYGRAPDLRSGCRLPIPGVPNDTAVDDSTGVVLVTLADAPRVVLLDGRADPTRIIGWVDLPAAPSRVVIDQSARRAWVSLPDAGQVALLEPDATDPNGQRWKLTGTFDAGSFPVFLAVDPARQRLLVSEQGQSPDVEVDQRKGAVGLYDTSVWPPAPIGDPMPAGLPTGALFDPASGTAYVLENGPDSLAWITFDASGTPAIDRVNLPYGDPSLQLNPVDLAFLPGGREIALTMSSGASGSSIGGHLDVFKLDAAGRPSWSRSIPAAQRTRGIAIDPTTGRLFVTDVTDGRLSSYDADVPVAAAPPPPQIDRVPAGAAPHLVRARGRGPDGRSVAVGAAARRSCSVPRMSFSTDLQRWRACRRCCR